MRLTRLELRNYRVFDDLDLELDEMTVLVGANDTGKSSVLEAIRWLLDRTFADPGWPSVRPSDAKREDAVITSIIGHLSDFSGDELQHLGPLAPDGILRLGKSSSEPGLSVVVEPDQVEAVMAGLDEDLLREIGVVGDNEPMVTSEILGFLGVANLDGKVWLDASIWEFGVKSGYALLDWLDSGGLAVVGLGGSSDTRWDPHAVIGPLVRRALERGLAATASRGGHEEPDDHSDDGPLVEAKGVVASTLAAVSDAHSRHLPSGGPFGAVRWHSSIGPAIIADAVLRHLDAEAFRRADQRHPVTSIDGLGPGARRSLALSALWLYRDAELWPPPRLWREPSLALLLVEEPETGLHPAAQRDVAEVLRDWPTFGLQMIVVTHSPTFVNASPISGLRLARRDERNGSANVVLPVGLSEIRDALGVQPADILLARTFLVVEGESDRGILVMWARQLGIDLEASGVQVVPSGGYSAVERVARFLTLAYEGARFVVALDNGSDSAKARMEIDQRFGSAVETVLLSRTDIEGFFASRAITAWLTTRATETVPPSLGDDVVEALATKPNNLVVLRKLARDYLHRDYDKLRDGLVIASLTDEQDVSAEIVDLLLRTTNAPPSRATK